MDEAQIREQMAKWAEEDHQKLLLLCEHYGIATTPISAFTFYYLTMRLARDFVPGFQDEQPKGRKSKWHPGNMGALVVEVERLVHPGDDFHGVSWAAGILAKKEPWKSFLADSEDRAALISRLYYEFKDDRFAKISRDAFRYDELTGNLEGWERLVIAMCEETPN
jgi:hypothetical protein